MALTQVPIELSSTPGIVDNSNATAITIDSSENVMVNRTSVFTTAKMEIQSDAGDASTLALNSIDTDGSILEFYKAGTAVGSIGSISGVVSNIVLDPRSSVKGAGIAGASNSASEGIINPTDRTGALADGAISLGGSSTRWKDLYLSGGVVFGSTGGAVTSKTLDDYEEGTWTPTIGQGTISSNYARYIKVGNIITVSGFIHTFSNRTSSSAVAIGGLPFVSNSQAVAVGATLSRYINAGTGGDPVMYTAVSNSVVHPYVMTKAGNYGNVLHSDLDNSNANIYFSITYEV